MPLIICQVELKFNWTKYCGVAAGGIENPGTNCNGIFCTIKDTKLYVLVITLSAKENQKLSKRHSKGFQTVYWNE